MCGVVSMQRDRCLRMWWIVLWVLICFGPYARSNLAGSETLEELVQHSNLIVWGEVTQLTPFWYTDKRGTHIYSAVEIVPYEWVVGGWSGSPLVFEVIGGEVDGITEWASDVPIFRTGEEVIVFLQDDPLRLVPGLAGKIEVYEGRIYWQGGEDTAGHFLDRLERFDRGEDQEILWPPSRQRTLLASAGSPVITGISPGQASAGTDTSVTLTGSNFGDVQGSGRVNFYRSGSASIQSWSDTRIICRIPEGASSGPVIVQASTGSSNGYVFKVTFGYNGYHWPSASTLVNYYINENCPNCTGEEAAVQRAASTWNSTGGPSLHYAGSHTRTTDSRNNKNEVMWGHSGSLAYARMWLYSSGDLIECDLVFSDAYDWNAEGSPSSHEYDVESVALHEMGHWMGLQDLYGDIGDGTHDVAKVMYGYTLRGGTKRSLHPADRDGMEWIYGDPPPPCSNPSPPTGVSASSGTYCDWVRISWNSVADATGYEVWRSTNSSVESATRITTVSQSPYDDTSAQMDTTYYYWIKTQGECGDSDFSAGVTGYCGSPIPTGISATDGVHCDRVVVYWNSIGGALRYEVWRGITNSTGSAVKLTDVTETHYEDVEVVSGITYTYWIKAESICGMSGFSSPDSGWRARPVERPVNVRASDGIYSDKVRVTWHAVTGATRYEIWRGTSDSSITALKIGEKTGSPYDDRTATAGTSYTYWIKAKNGCYTSDFSTGDAGNRAEISTNAQPVIVSTAPESATVGRVYRYAVKATGSPTPALRLSSGPEGMVLQESEGLLIWTPTPAQIGEHMVWLYAINTYGTIYQGFVITVESEPDGILYVDDDALSGGDGLSWATAFQYLQDALMLAEDPQTGIAEIRVAAGIYQPDQGNDLPSSDLGTTFRLIEYVQIKGGYQGLAFLDDPNARDVVLFESILRGSGGQEGQISLEGTDFLRIIDGSNRNANAVLDGFVIEQGEIQGVDQAATHSTALFINAGSPTIRHCSFRGNSALGLLEDSSDVDLLMLGFGGAVYIDGGNPCFEFCLFTENTADYGGALYAKHSEISCTGCRFEGNQAQSGGAVAGEGPGTFRFVNCVFSGNTALGKDLLAPWPLGKGGGVACFQDCEVDVINCTFISNSASNGGHAIAIDNHVSTSGSNVTIVNSILWDHGEVVWNGNDSTVTIQYSNIQGGPAAIVDPYHGLVWGPGNIQDDPLFRGQNNWHLGPVSPCINIGNNAFLPSDRTDLDRDEDVNEPIPYDIVGHPRSVGLAVDMGASEYQSVD